MRQLLLLSAFLATTALAAPTIQQFTYSGSPAASAIPGMVVKITGSGFTGATAVMVGTATDGAFTVVSDSEIDWTVPVDGPPGGVLSITTPSGQATAPALSVMAYPTPPIGALCLPTIASLHTLVNPSTGNTIVVLSCDLVSGTYHYATAGNAINWMQSQCLTTIEPFSVSTLWLQHAWSACVDRVMLQSDQAYANRLFFMWVPRPTVLGSTAQPVLTLNASGTIGPQLSIASVPQTIAGGTVTSGLRVPSGTVSPRYCDVSRQMSVQNTQLPSNSFALCTLIYAPLGGFQFPASQDGVSLQAPTDAMLVDTAHNVWGIDSNGIITVNGIEDSTSSSVTALVFINGLMWQRNASNLWWSKTAPTAAWLPPAGTATAPL